MKKIVEIWNKLKLWQQLLVILVVVGIAFSAFLFSTKPSAYNLLYSDLSASEATQIESQLATMGVEYETQNKNTTIMVKTPDVATIRMKLASEGLPSASGPGFELFDSTSLGTSTFQNNVNYTRAVVGNVQRTLVQGIDNIQSAQVQIPLIDNSNSIFSQDDTPLTAKVLIKEKTGTKLTENQVKGIQNFVAGAAKNLKPENVTVIDESGVISDNNSGSSNSSSGSNNPSSGSYDKQQQIETGVENKIKSDIVSTVGPVVGGSNHIKISVRANINFDEIVQNIQKYDPTGTLVSSQSDKESTTDNSSNQVEAGTASNGTVPQYQQQGSTTGTPVTTSQKDSEIQNFDVGKTVETIRKNPELQTLFVSVYVDEKQISLDKLTSLKQNIAASAGLIDDKNGDGNYQNGQIVLNTYEFQNNQTNQRMISSTDNTEKTSAIQDNMWMLIAIGGLLLVIVILLVAFILSSKKKEKEIESGQPIERTSTRKVEMEAEDDEIEVNVPTKKEDRIREKFIEETVKLANGDKQKTIEYFKKSLNER